MNADLCACKYYHETLVAHGKYSWNQARVAGQIVLFSLQTAGIRLCTAR